MHNNKVNNKHTQTIQQLSEEIKKPKNPINRFKDKNKLRRSNALTKDVSIGSHLIFDFNTKKILGYKTSVKESDLKKLIDDLKKAQPYLKESSHLLEKIKEDEKLNIFSETITFTEWGTGKEIDTDLTATLKHLLKEIGFQETHNNNGKYLNKLTEIFKNRWAFLKQGKKKKHTKEYLKYTPEEKDAAKKMGRFILKNRDKLSYQGGIYRAKNFTVDDSFDSGTIGNQIGSGGFGGVKTINANSNDDKEYVIKQDYDRRTRDTSKDIKLKDTELFYSHWVPKAHFLRAEKKEVIDENGNPALVYEKGIMNVGDLYDKLLNGKSKNSSKFSLSCNHFSIKAYLSSLRHGFDHRDMHLGNMLIMKDGGLKFTDYGESRDYTPEYFHSDVNRFLYRLCMNIDLLKVNTPEDNKSYGTIHNLHKKIFKLRNEIWQSSSKDPDKYKKKLTADLEELANLDLWKDKDNNTLILSKDEILKLATS